MSTIERMHAAVLQHRIAWDDLVARVALNEKIPSDQAGPMVEKLYDKHSVCLQVAVAIIDIIVEADRGASDIAVDLQPAGDRRSRRVGR